MNRFETKNAPAGANPADLPRVIAELGQAFNEFKSTNEQRLKAVEQNKPTGDFEAKLANIDKALTDLDGVKSAIDELSKRSARDGLGGDAQAQEHKKAFNRMMRKGDDDGLMDLQAKALNLGTDTDGGYAVPEEIDRSIIQLERNLVPMRQIANVITVGTEDYKKLVNSGGAVAGWVGETAARPETAAPKLGQVAPFFGELYANPAATQKMLDDVFFDAEAWLASELSITFGEKENAAFTSGDGVSKAKGILAYANAVTSDATRALGTLQYVVSGAAATINADALLDLVYALKSGYRANASWMMNPLTISILRKLKDVDGQYIWRPGLDAGEPSTLLSKAIVENDDMPIVAANSLPIAFGDFKRGYTIADVRGTRVLRDPYTNKPYVSFYTTKRVGGGVMDSNAIKLLKVSV
ncbi:phage major capsid protein [Deefgea rivuli]|uniref:phage major capsid protein n=1 Tax=Deefgea rivuli TaxID=400948 RepID=UPI00068463A9|nr:phage major capsid protein [Deefgea rivuli]